MTEKEKALGQMLSKIADELNITPTMQQKAISSYEAVGKWIGEGLDYNVRIMPQGSMNLGTVIKPIDDRDDYDIDLVCLLENGHALPLDKLKHVVGDRLKEHKLYNNMLEKEGKRCWTMQYDEFHMDILPCAPREIVYIEPYLTAIKLTHKNIIGGYEPRYSNPYAYHKWFEKRMENVLNVEKRSYAERNQVEVEEVPTYQVRTPLQKVIQLLKRHRDICFENNAEDAPISIIITTLAAHAYNGEIDIYEAMCSILNKMAKYIECRNGVFWIENPVMKEENFADKWNDSPNKRIAFMSWLAQARKDLIDEPLSCLGINNVANKYKICLGRAPVDRAIKQLGTLSLIHI